MASANEVIAEVENLGDTLVFHPVVQFHELLLTVTGPCSFEYRQRVTEGEPFFRLDETTIDGRYTYDLVRLEAVDPAIVKVLLQARANDDPETPKQLCRDGKLPTAPISQSEGFGVSRGKIVYDPGAIEKSAAKPAAKRGLRGGSAAFPVDLGGNGAGTGVSARDFVINDDLIVDGSACIGFDCVNGEVFSFDTIRLKENNLRIKFDDTSVVPSFPANDWQLTANESANGGASKFSIEDVSGSRTPFTVEANARSHSLYVDDGGRIGSRTSTPSVEIHTIDGDTPTLRLQQDGSSGFEPQTWDVAGNETNFFVRDVTNGSTLPLRIRPSAPSNSIFVDVDGNVGIGTSSPSEDLTVFRSSGNVDFKLDGSSTDWRWRANQTNDTMTVIDDTNGTAPFVLKANADTNLLQLGVTASGRIDITGSLFINGVDNSNPDYVFEPDYELESIEEHAEYMWREKHLPAVGAGRNGADGKATIDVAGRSQGMLEELEKAHIYIEQLHKEIRDMRANLEQMQDLEARLNRLEGGVEK